MSGGVCIFTSLDVPSNALPLHTSLQAVAVRIHSTSLITVCCLYLPPNTVIHQHDLNNLVDQLPAPFIILVTSMDIALCGVVRRRTLVADRLNRYPTTENLLAFKKAKANARRVRRRSQRQSWIRYVSSLTSSTSSKQLWKKVKAANGVYREFSFPILQTSNSVFSSPEEIANILGETFQSVSSAASYNSRFLEIKRRAERTPINFSTRSFFPYNCNFTMTELKKALIQAHNTSPGLDGITYTMLRHLHPNSLANILFLFNRVWKEHCFPSSWREAIVIPILKPGKVATDPLSYRPIGLTSCFCKTFERMVNTRLVYVLEKEECISPLQSGFRKGRSTLDNLVFLESQIKDAFVRRNHLVSIFFDIEKAYDRTWRYGILRNMYDFGLRGNLPIFIFNFLAVRYFNVRIGYSSSHKFIQDQGVPQGSVLSVTLFNIHE
ncbi:probable RNA-directed DNA polymerase from transposon X-element [Trichonephila clavipes]|nr:probable RNA-directed DNA polymerase from transposon X-element [Trichonephila clavipes]